VVAAAATQPATTAIQSPGFAPQLGTLADYESALVNLYAQVNQSVVLRAELNGGARLE